MACCAGMSITAGDASASIVAIEDIPGSYRPNVLSLVLEELETQRALGRVLLAEHDREIALRTNSRVSPNAKLHLLIIGISAYNEDNAKNLRLRYANRDASDLANALMETQNNLYDLSPQVLLDEDATRSGIRWALKVMHESMRTGGNDLAVVFFSGHGALIDDGRSRKLFLLPTDVDARNDQAIADTALSADELTDKVRLLAERGRVLLLLDACHSGARYNGRRTTQDGFFRVALASRRRERNSTHVVERGRSFVRGSNLAAWRVH